MAVRPNEPAHAPASDRRVVVVIPARGGSKGVRLKNLRPVAGRSLVARAVDAALGAELVTDVIVSTDHSGIAREAARAGARIVERPAELSGDGASSESAVLHVLDTLAVHEGEEPVVTVLLQCTSPFIFSEDLDEAVRRVMSGDADVSFSVIEDHGFMWTRNQDGEVAAVGHDAAHRPRRQDRAPQYRETGAFYAMRTSGLRARRHRFFGTLDTLTVPAWSAPEIDTEEDLRLVGAVAAGRSDARADTGPDVDALVTDFDGVHTDDAVWVSQDGAEAVRVHRGDGLGVEHLRSAGVRMLILSKERNPVVGARAAKLRVPSLQGVDDKAGALSDWMHGHDLDPGRVAYLGNDLNDLPAMSMVGWPLAVADARPEVLAAARLVLSARGGHGAVREACDRIAAARGANPAAHHGDPARPAEHPASGTNDPGEPEASDATTSPAATATV